VDGDERAYFNLSAAHANCGIKSLSDYHLVVVALKDISKGEELFTPYGINYWRIKNSQNTN
jgi:SET domain-containing protein